MQVFLFTYDIVVARFGSYNRRLYGGYNIQKYFSKSVSLICSTSLFNIWYTIFLTYKTNSGKAFFPWVTLTSRQESMVSKDFFRRCQFLRGLSYAFIIHLGKRGVNKRCVRKQIRIFFGIFRGFFLSQGVCFF